MLYRALKSFVGKERMKRGEVKEINNDFIVNDLLNAGLIEAVEEKTETAQPPKIEAEPITESTAETEAEPTPEPAPAPKKTGRPKKLKT